MKLKRFFASFSIVCLLFSVSLVPCFADEPVSSTDYALGIYFAPPTYPPAQSSKMVFIPSSYEYVITDGVRPTSHAWAYLQVSSNYYEPVDHDRTVYVTVGYMSEPSGLDVSFNGTGATRLRYNTLGSTSQQELVNGVTFGGSVSSIWVLESTSIQVLKITIPANSTSFIFHTQGFAEWNIPANELSTINSYGGFIFDTADEAILNILEEILADTGLIGEKATTMVSVLNSIYNQLRNLNTDTDTIISILNSLTDLSESQLDQLELISSNVEAIYYFLTEALASESADASEAIQETVNSIDNSHAAEAYWQTSMQGNYDSLNLDNFSFGGITGGVELVGRIFSDMFSAFGSYQILFTFPLILGIALLVIGRMSKFGGGNSSRSSEHKGGEGGA